MLAACAPPGDEDDPRLVPPVLGQESIEAWFEEGFYLSWTCELDPHPAFDPSPHGIVRICANEIARTAPSSGEHPVDTALVIEIFDDRGEAVVGRGAQRHSIPGADGDSWYWYMRVPLTSATPHDDDGLAANGWGFDGPALTVCTGCHGVAGVDHPGHDFVWVDL